MSKPQNGGTTRIGKVGSGAPQSRIFTRGAGGGISAPASSPNTGKKGSETGANVRNRGAGGAPAKASGPNTGKKGSDTGATIRNRGGGGSIGGR